MTKRSNKKSSKGSPAELNCYKIAQVDGEVLLMKRRRTLGVAHTKEGLKSTLGPSARSWSRDWRREEVLQIARPHILDRIKILGRG